MDLHWTLIVLLTIVDCISAPPPYRGSFERLSGAPNQHGGILSDFSNSFRETVQSDEVRQSSQYNKDLAKDSSVIDTLVPLAQIQYRSTEPTNIAKDFVIQQSLQLKALSQPQNQPTNTVQRQTENVVNQPLLVQPNRPESNVPANNDGPNRRQSVERTIVTSADRQIQPQIPPSTGNQQLIFVPQLNVNKNVPTGQQQSGGKGISLGFTDLGPDSSATPTISRNPQQSRLNSRPAALQKPEVGREDQIVTINPGTQANVPTPLKTESTDDGADRQKSKPNAAAPLADFTCVLLPQKSNRKRR